ncbi:hypothetical protein GUJ93_ZPchr0010g7559 [Zizania palustris]|uniref:Uncharacterized protein n=1 Tax=Zizania palustris TaxID=103762 RepID=A0A8J5WAU0_ZIZPA|nr:hypothetical protein GUJ93_ZPchr0010g7559 [Zizania palustris]
MRTSGAEEEEDGDRLLGGRGKGGVRAGCCLIRLRLADVCTVSAAEKIGKVEWPLTSSAPTESLQVAGHESMIAKSNYDKENFEVLVRMTDPGESCQKHSKWLSHWTKGSSSAEPQVGKDESVQNPMMHKDVKLYAKTAASKSLSIQKLSEFSLDFQKHVSSDNLNLEWNHIPTFGINPKSYTVLNPKRRSAKNAVPSNVSVPQQTVKLNMTTSNVVSSQEYELHSHLITGHLSFEMSCSCSKDDNNSSSDSLLDKQHTSHCSADSDQEPTCRCSEEKLKSSENNNKNHGIGSSSQNQKSIAPGIHKQEGSAGVILCTLLGKEFETEQINCPNNSKKDDIISDVQQHLNTERIVSAANVSGSYMLPDPTANTIKVNNRAEVVTQPLDIVADSAKQKAPYFFERLTIPSQPQDKNPEYEYSRPSGNSTAFGVHMSGTSIGSRRFGANKSSAKTETLYNDTQHVSESSAGISSLLARKDHSCAKKAKSKQMATMYMKANGFQNVNEHQDVSSKAAMANKQQCYIPGTESMDLGLMPFQVSRLKKQVSIGTTQSQARGEPSDKWLKRLHIDNEDPHLPGHKRAKVGDGRPVGGPSSTHGDVVITRHDRSDDDMADRGKDKQALDDEGMKLQGVRETSPVPAKCTDRWIGRWRQGAPHVLHEVDDQGQEKKAAKPVLASGGPEGQFLPSIRAMALMGRAMSKVRPCAREKRGPFMVWKT